MAITDNKTNVGSTIVRRGNRGWSSFGFEAMMLNKKYKMFGKKGEGTFSEVLKCQNVKDGKYYACKKMKQHYTSMEHVNNLREIQAMRRLLIHPNIISLHEVIFDERSGTLALILELMDMNIYELIRGRKEILPEKSVKKYMWQLCRAIEHIHRHGIFHRDVKPENILIKDDTLKLADFGSCRSMHSKQPYTEYISTRWYRSPECLLTEGFYNYAMDIWSIGCVMFEVLSLRPLFPGANEVDQISKIHDVVGTPDQDILNKFKKKTRSMSFNFPAKKGSGFSRALPYASRNAVDLIKKMCEYDPDHRITAKMILNEPYFNEFREQAEKQREPLHQSQTPREELPSVTPRRSTGPPSEREEKENALPPTKAQSRDHFSPLVKPAKMQSKSPHGETVVSSGVVEDAMRSSKGEGAKTSQTFPQSLHDHREKDKERRKKGHKAYPYYYKLGGRSGAASGVTFPGSLLPKLAGPTTFLLGGGGQLSGSYATSNQQTSLAPRGQHFLGNGLSPRRQEFQFQRPQAGGISGVSKMPKLLPHHLPSLQNSNGKYRGRNKVAELSKIYGIRHLHSLDKANFPS